MTALDRALAKAFQGPTSCPPTADAKSRVAVPPIPVSLAATLPQAPADLAAASAAPSEKPLSHSGRPVPDKRASQPMAHEPATAPVGPSAADLLNEAFRATKVAARATAPVGPSVAALLGEAIQAKMVTVEMPSPAETGETRPLPTKAHATTDAPLITLPVRAASMSREPNDTSWRPLLQVDRVVWPSVHGRLQTTAPAAIEQMSDGLLSICASGSKVVGLAGCASGEGVTTLLLVVAGKLLSQGRKVVVVDANWGNPQLAQSLSLSPQKGWEETLCRGLPLEEVIIESRADGLAVLPVCRSSVSTIAPGRIAISFNVLAREFDVVLVDLGPLVDVEDETSFSHAAAAQTDAVILVQNVRATTSSRLAQVRQRLSALNLQYAGTFQNFVASSQRQKSFPSRSRFVTFCDFVWRSSLGLWDRNRGSTGLVVALGWVR